MKGVPMKSIVRRIIQLLLLGAPAIAIAQLPAQSSVQLQTQLLAQSPAQSPAQPPAQPMFAPASKNIRIVVPFSAGGSNDVIARAIAGPLGKRQDLPVIVDNRPGAAGVVG